MSLVSLGKVAAISIAVLSVPCAAQQTRVGISVGLTRLAFETGWGGGGDFFAAVAQARLTRSFNSRLGGEVAGVIVALGGASAAVADCIPNVPCPDYQTPSVYWAALPSLTIPFGSSAWRASVGAGGVTATGMKGPGSRSSLAGSIGIDWGRTGAGLTPTIGIRALGLTSKIAGIRYMILPTVGIQF